MKFSLRKCAHAGPAWPSNVAKAQQGTVPALLPPLVLGFLELALLDCWLGPYSPCNVRRSRLILPWPRKTSVILHIIGEQQAASKRRKVAGGGGERKQYESTIVL